MEVFRVGDVVARKSYGGDVYFVVTNVTAGADGKLVYALRGLLYRIFADSASDDLMRIRPVNAFYNVQKSISEYKRHAFRNDSQVRYSRTFTRVRVRNGRVLHVDSSSSYLDICMNYYRESGLKAYSSLVPENEQPYMLRRLLEQYNPDILVLTGHDGISKGADKYSMDSYRNSKYFVSSVKEARKYESSMDKLCIFAGACQSYYEAIMDAGANFASSPGRVLINALDPAFVAQKVAVTDERQVVTPREIALITKSGSDGIGGINTKGHAKKI